MVNPTVDIIIPVYNAYDDLVRCVESVRRCTAGNYRLILLDDCSPDDRVAAYFDQLRAQADPLIMLLGNERNLGFVRTVNRAMALSDRDVVLLNSDTIVTTGWLEKLLRCAATDSYIGTITPFSNNAEICSFPILCRNNSLGPFEPELLNRALEEAALPSYPDIPTAVGFCMYIRRALLNKIGLFDAEIFGLGYGEENDFCMRAAGAGYRNVLCDDTFVAHVGNSSFLHQKQALTEKSMQRLLVKHPDYMRHIMAYIAADPTKPIREVAQSFLAWQGSGGDRPGILHILHGRKGGTEQHIRALVQASNNQCRHYLLITMDETWMLEDLNASSSITYLFQHQRDELWADFLGGLCQRFHVDVCHVHHISGCRAGLLQAFAALSIPYGFTIHDFYLACPTINLLNQSGKFCNAQTQIPVCQSCLSAQPDFVNIGIDKWREAHQHFLDRAAFIIAPTQWAADTFTKYYQSKNVQMIPHGVPEQTASHPAMCPVFLVPQDKHHNIGVVGAIGPVKGARTLERLVKRTRERDLPMRWVVIGYLDCQFLPHQDADKILTIHGQYDPKDIEVLLDHYRIRLLVFPSAGPETFSYTLTEGWAAGRPALVPPIGALGERMRAAGAGWLMENWLDEDQILDQVMRVLQLENRDDFEQRAKRAQSVLIVTLQEMAQTTLRIYKETAVKKIAMDIKPFSKERLLHALKLAAGEFNGRRKNKGLSEKILIKCAHWGLRLRYTVLGRWLYKTVPIRWQRRLKDYLLA